MTEHAASSERAPLRLVPVSFREACAFVAEHHRHHRPPRGHKYSVGVARDGVLVGVAMVGRVIAELPARRGWDTPSRRRGAGVDGVPRTLWEAVA